MRAYRFVLAPVLVIGGLLLQHAARSEEYRGTLEQQLACTPDVWRLCAAQIPDAERIVACLQANTPQLSDGCRAVFESNASAEQPQPPQRVPPRGRVAPLPRTDPSVPR